MATNCVLRPYSDHEFHVRPAIDTGASTFIHLVYMSSTLRGQLLDKYDDFPKISPTSIVTMIHVEDAWLESAAGLPLIAVAKHMYLNRYAISEDKSWLARRENAV